MVNGGFLEGLNKLSNWVLQMIYLNFLWIIFTLLGIVIAGFFPSTTAMFTIIRKWNSGEKDFPIFQTFRRTYKLEFLRGNILGYPLFLVGIVLYVDLLLLHQTDSSFLQLLYIPVLFLFFLNVITFSYVFPISVKYNLRGLHIVKNALLFTIITPLSSLKMVLGLVFISFLLLTFPGFILILSGSITSLFITKVATGAFIKFDERHKSLQINK